MSEGNEVDLRTVVAVLHGVLSAQDVQGRKLDGLTVKVDDHGRKLDRLASDVATLRQTVIEYHASVLGHGILISELDMRPRRVEQHLNLPPAA